MKKRIHPLVLGIFLFIVVGLIALINPFQEIQWNISDLFFKGRGASQEITIIAIDDKSLNPANGLGRFKDWPRSYYAQLLRAINPQSPRVVAFDLDFRNPAKGMSDLRIKQLLQKAQEGSVDFAAQLKRFATEEGAASTHPDDTDFQDVLNQTSAVVLASSLNFKEKVEEYSKDAPTPQGSNDPLYKGPTITTGYTDIFPDHDGVLRHVSFHMGERTSFAEAIVKSAGGRGAADTGRINYAAKPFSYNIISFADALAGTYDPALIKDKIILVGATAPVIQDFHATPTSRVPMAGVEINANLVQQIMEGKNLHEQGIFGLLCMLAFFALAGSFIFLRLPLAYIGPVFAAVLLLFPAVAYGFYQTGTVLNVVYPETAWILTVIAALWYRNKTEFREKAEIKRAFAHYVSPIVVNELAKNPESLKLGGKRQDISVLFSDIVGFTTLSEKLTPEDTVAVLNDYLTAMTEVVFGFNGTLDKYQGDAIMALYGAPLIDEHHAMNACHAALGMRKALGALHAKWNAIPKLPFKEELIQLDFRVGISTGPAVIGNVGSQKRFDYTAIGDIVNLGSRMESINRKYGTRVIVDKATFVAITNNHNPFIFRKLDTVRVKGKKMETEIFELVATSETTPGEVKSMLDDFENGRILYTQRNFMEAKQYFEAALAVFPEDGPARIYANRCNFFMRKPPARDWDAVVELQEK